MLLLKLRRVELQRGTSVGQAAVQHRVYQPTSHRSVAQLRVPIPERIRLVDYKAWQVRKVSSRNISTISSPCSSQTCHPADPFADRNANPFADPSVQGALGSSRAYDDGDAASAYKGGAGWGAHESSTGVNDLDYESSGAPASGPGSANREEELRRRERELEQRERELQQRADHIQKHGRNNWPFCECSIPSGGSYVAVLAHPRCSIFFVTISYSLSVDRKYRSIALQLLRRYPMAVTYLCSFSPPSTMTSRLKFRRTINKSCNIFTSYG